MCRSRFSCSSSYIITGLPDSRGICLLAFLFSQKIARTYIVFFIIEPPKFLLSCVDRNMGCNIFLWPSSSSLADNLAFDLQLL